MSDVATKDDIAEVMNAFEEFKQTVDARDKERERKNASDPLYADKIAKLEGALDAGEKLNQKLTQELQQQKLATEAALETLETKMSRLTLGADRAIGMSAKERRAEIMSKADAWARAAHKAIVSGRPNLNGDESKALDDVEAAYKALNITDDTGGGYLAPVDFQAEILKSVVLISPVRSLAKIRTTANKQMKIPRRISLLSATWEDEEEEAEPATGLKYGLVEVFTRGLRAIVDISNDMLEDAAFDMAAEINDEVSEQFAVAEGAAFVNGSGPGRPEGFLVNKAVTADDNLTVTGDATQLTPDSVISCYHELKSAYARNAVWAANRQTIGGVRQLKDSVGQYLFAMGLPNGLPNTILGSPYVEVPDMPAVAAGALPLAIGDFGRGYSLVDRISMTMLRDPFTQGAKNNVRYLFRKRLGGQVTMAEAIKPLKVAA